MKQKIIEAHYKDDLFICPSCNKEKKYYATGICGTCYRRNYFFYRYHTDDEFRKKIIKETNKKQKESGYTKLRYFVDKIGNMDNIERLCLNYGFSKDVSNAIAMDGSILDDKMREKGIII